METKEGKVFLNQIIFIEAIKWLNGVSIQQWPPFIKSLTEIVHESWRTKREKVFFNQIIFIEAIGMKNAI